MYKKRDPARANLLFCLINLCCFDVLVAVAVAVAVVAKTPLFFIGTTTWNENEKERGRNWAQLPVLNFPLCYWATLGAIDFSCAVSCFRVVRIVEQHSRKNLSWNPGYGQARLRSVRAIVTVVAFSFLNLPELLVCFSPSIDGISTVAVTPFSPCMTVWLNTFITTASRVVKFLSKLVL